MIIAVDLLRRSIELEPETCPAMHLHLEHFVVIFKNLSPSDAVSLSYASLFGR